jgi:hypothetical protein
LLDGRHYAIDSIKPPGTPQIAAGDSIVVFLSFAPKNVSMIYDTLLVNFVKPCTDSIKVSLSGFGKGIPPTPIIRLRIDDIALDPQVSPVTIPILAWIEPNTALLPIDTLTFNCEYNPTMMRIRSVQNGRVVNTYNPVTLRENSTISAAVGTLKFSPDTVLRLTADVFLGDAQSDSLTITSVVVHPLAAFVLRTNGAEVSYQGLCQQGSTRLLGQSYLKALTVFPIPSGDEVHIISVDRENGHHAINLFNTEGVQKWSAMWSGRVNNINNFDIPTTTLSSGVYTLVLRTQTETLVRQVVVVK